MNISKVVRQFEKIENIRDSIMTIGKFNGVHIGHQEIIKYIVDKARTSGKVSVVLMINIHKKSIYNLDYNVEILKKLGVNYIVVIDFSSEFYKMSYSDFFYKVKEYYNISEIAIGEDFAFGHNREGKIADLKLLGQKSNVAIKVFPFYLYNNEKVSSSNIVEHIENGHMELVSVLLGRQYSYTSIVESGKRLGHTIGFATANLKTYADVALPRDGVYFSKTVVHKCEKPFMSMTFVGSTSLVGSLKFETHIFDFDRDIYGEKIEVMLFYYHRGNIEFGSISELKSTLEEDKINTYRYFK